MLAANGQHAAAVEQLRTTMELSPGLYKGYESLVDGRSRSVSPGWWSSTGWVVLMTRVVRDSTR